MHFELLFLLLFSVATAVALVARWLKLPYTVALVLAGLVLESGHLFAVPRLTKELLYAVFLPGLLFEAAFHIDFGRFWRNRWTINALAVPGLLVAVGATAGLLVLGLRLTPGARFHWPEAFLFGALIAATDPIAVIATFKSLGAPRRLAMLVEGESLLNDGTAVVVFTLVLGVLGGHAQSPGAIALEFVKVVGVGALIGGGVGLAASQVTMRVDEPMIEITLTTIAAYGSFAIAEHLHFSGVIAVVVAGMVCGNYGAKHGMSPSTKLAVESFWEYVAFALNSAVFLFIGFQVRIGTLVHAWRPILVAFAAVTLARVVVVYGVTIALGRTSEKTPWSWRAVMAWGGLRGGLSMVLALSLPSSIESREFLINLTFGVVLLSIVVQGLTMAPLLRRLGIAGHSAEERLAFEEHRAVLRATTTVLGRLEEMVRDGQLTETRASEVRERYEQRRGEARSALAELHLAQKAIEEEEVRAATRQLTLLERAAVNEAHERGLMGRAAYERLIEDVDARLMGEEDD